MPSPWSILQTMATPPPPSLKRIPKSTNDITVRDVRLLRGLALAHAKKRGRPHLGEEFVSFAYEAMVKQGYWKYRISWIWSTFLRDTLGNMTNKVGKAKSEANSNMKPMDKEVFRVKDTTPEPGHRLEWAEFLKELDVKTRVIAALRYEFDFTNVEIGQVLGISHERVRQVADEMLGRMRKGKLPVPAFRDKR